MRKKTLLIAAVTLLSAASAKGQLVEVASIDKIATASAVDMAEISPDGTKAIVSGGCGHESDPGEPNKRDRA